MGNKNNIQCNDALPYHTRNTGGLLFLNTVELSYEQQCEIQQIYYYRILLVECLKNRILPLRQVSKQSREILQQVR